MRICRVENNPFFASTKNGECITLLIDRAYLGHSVEASLKSIFQAALKMILHESKCKLTSDTLWGLHLFGLSLCRNSSKGKLIDIGFETKEFGRNCFIELKVYYSDGCSNETRNFIKKITTETILSNAGLGYYHFGCSPYSCPLGSHCPGPYICDEHPIGPCLQV